MTRHQLWILRLPVMLMILLAVSLLSYGQAEKSQFEIKGIYGHPAPLWEAGYHLNELGVNAVFAHNGSIDSVMIHRARQEGARVFAEFATLNGKGYVDDHPDAHAINDRGERVEPASWFMGVCPINAEFRAYRFQQLRDLLSRFDLDGVWMDYVHWHAQFEDPEPILPETCFCGDCLVAFAHYSGLDVQGNSIAEQATWILYNHDSTWREWRCEVIAQWAVEMKAILQEMQSDALLGLYHCPWEDHAFDGARYRILGLDYSRLAGIIDVYSPMVYHGRMGREPDWVKKNTEWHSNKLSEAINLGAKLWPIVQAHNDPYVISAKEFETVLLGGLAGKSSGVMMFTTRSLAEDPDKVEVMRRLYMGEGR